MSAASDVGAGRRALRTDIAVIGGGPAGSVAARRLAKLGYDVVLVHAPRTGRNIETLAPSLILLGDDVLEAEHLAAISQPVRIVHSDWSGDGDAARDSPGARLVRRGEFDRMVLSQASRAGVVVLSPARAAAPQRRSAGWVVPVPRDGAGIEIAARFIVDARGRRGSRIGFAPRTVALSASWTGVSLERGEMRIAAHPDGWCWAASSSAGSADVTVFLQARACGGLGRAKLQERYLAMLSETPLFAGPLRAGTPGTLSIADATPSLTREPANARRLAIGDAALTLDPLSSQGIVAACRAAIQAAAVVHTILSGGDREAAIAFYAGRLNAVRVQHARSAAALYGEHTAWRDRPFWRERIRLAERAAQADAPPPRAQPDRPLIVSPLARIVRVPALVGDKVELQDAISHPGLAEPVVWLGRHCVPDLLACMQPGGGASALAAHIDGSCSLPEARALVDWLTHVGILESETGPVITDETAAHR